MRPKNHIGAQFTITQRDAWLGHVICAADMCETSKEFRQILGSWLRLKVDEVYSRWLNDLHQTKNIKLIEKNDKDEEKQNITIEYAYYPSISSGIFGSWLYNKSSPKL